MVRERLPPADPEAITRLIATITGGSVFGLRAGYESMRQKRLGAEVTGVDFSEEPIRIAREKNPDIRFEIQDFRYLSPELGCFNGITAVASLIHIPDNELDLVFGSMKSVLTENGFAMIIIVEGRASIRSGALSSVTASNIVAISISTTGKG